MQSQKTAAAAFHLFSKHVIGIVANLHGLVVLRPKRGILYLMNGLTNFSFLVRIGGNLSH